MKPKQQQLRKQLQIKLWGQLPNQLETQLVDQVRGVGKSDE